MKGSGTMTATRTKDLQLQADTASSHPNGAGSVYPVLTHYPKEIQAFGTIARHPIGLDESVCLAGAAALNQVLADTMTLRDLYKKHHWQVSGPTFYALHLLFDKHFNEQSKLVDEIAERIQALGGISVAMAHDVVQLAQVPRAPRGREAAPVQISRLLEAHEIILKEARQAAHDAASAGDDGTNDLLVGDVVRTNELQVWFLAEHLAQGKPGSEITDDL